MDTHTISFDVKVSVNITPAAAFAWGKELEKELRYIEGDDADTWPVMPTLPWFVARYLDRQGDPFSMLHDVLEEMGEDEDQYDWFGEDVTQ